MDFAPYQDENPETVRTLSPPPPKGLRSPRLSSSRSPPPVNRSITGIFHANSPLPSPSRFEDAYQNVGRSSYDNPSFAGAGAGGIVGGGLEAGRNFDAFQTSLPMRLDYEAMLAYLLLPPAGGVFLLLVETKSDYVRFHAWQSAMLFSALFILHLLIAWSSFLSWLLLIIDLALIAFLSLHAYRDVDTLDHYEIPIVGRLANSFVDDE